MFQTAAANHKQIQELAFDILRFLTLIQLDIATWCQVVGEHVDGQTAAIANVYYFFKTKFCEMIRKVPCLQGLAAVKFPQTLESVQAWVGANKTSLMYHPCIWVDYCAQVQAQMRMPGRTRIFYGIPPVAALDAQLREAQKSDVLSRQFQTPNLYSIVCSGLSGYASSATFLDFMHEKIEYPPSWFKGLSDKR